jgi:hypothetical protein
MFRPLSRSRKPYAGLHAKSPAPPIELMLDDRAALAQIARGGPGGIELGDGVQTSTAIRLSLLGAAVGLAFAVGGEVQAWHDAHQLRGPQ